MRIESISIDDDLISYNNLMNAISSSYKELTAFIDKLKENEMFDSIEGDKENLSILLDHVEKFKGLLEACEQKTHNLINPKVGEAPIAPQSTENEIVNPSEEALSDDTTVMPEVAESEPELEVAELDQTEEVEQPSNDDVLPSPGPQKERKNIEPELIA